MNEKNRHLITCADEKTWVFDQPVLFLGKWCLLNERKHQWSKLDYKIVPNHWHDSFDIYHDSIVVEQLYEKLLKELSGILNNYHNINWSLRAWRIMIGPWLSKYISIMLDRFKSIQSIKKHFNITTASFTVPDWEYMLPIDLSQFSELSKTDLWNYHIYSVLLKNEKKITLIKKDPSNSKDDIIKGNSIPKIYKVSMKNNFRTVKQIIRGSLSKIYNSKLYHSFSMWVAQKNKYFLYTTYIKSKVKILHLSMAMGDFPILIKEINDPQPDKINWDDRKNLQIENNVYNDQEKVIRQLLPKLIPIIYLEGFKDLLKYVKDIGLPKNNKVIVTTIGYQKDEVFKAWTAMQVQQGSSLVLAQHGGEYGSTILSFAEQHELEISDNYLTWGWHNQKNKTTSVPMLLLIGNKKSKWHKDGPIVIICSELARYMTQMHLSHLFGDRAQDYVNRLERFINNIPKEIKNILLFKLAPGDRGRGNSLEYIFNNKFPECNIIPGHSSLNDLLRRSRLSLHTYDGTPFLEAIGNDQPCMLMFDPSITIIRDDAKIYYSKLKEVGVFHESPESAANMIKKVSNDIETWWNQKDVVNSREIFCNQFARRSDQPIRDLKNSIIESL